MNSMQTTGVYPWEFELSGEIQEFHIWYSQCIEAIMFVYKDNNNKIINSPRFGSKAGGSVHVEKFDAEDYILGVKGYLGFVDGIPVVSGFQWLTSREWGKPVSTPSAVGTYDLSLASGDKRLRFYGNYGTKYLHSFGFAAAPHTNSANGFGEQPVVPAVPRDIIEKDGPFGGPGGTTPWKFKYASQIRGIDITCGVGACVYSIVFHYRNNDNKDLSSKKIGGDGGHVGLLEKVRLDDNEKIIGISGTFGVYAGHNVITSISFATPLRTHGPFGTVNGTKFSSHRPQAMITEFYGNYGYYLDSIGAVFLINHDANINNGYVRELVEAQVENNPAYVIAKDGPFGGDGAPWEFSFPDKLREIHIWSDKHINSIMFVYRDNDNKEVKSQRFGGEGGNLNQVTLGDNDFLTGFGGSYGDFEGNIVLMSIRFRTTQWQKQFGSIHQGHKFDVVRTGPLKLIKFHGKYGTCIHSIGAVYESNEIDREHVVLPGENINGSETTNDKTIDNDKNNAGKAVTTKRDGPFGGDGGTSHWEFKFVDKIREIEIMSEKCVNSIAFVYRDKENKDRYSQHFGGNGGKPQKVTLDDNEHIIGISGTHAFSYGNIVITSLSFETPHRIWGPYGTIRGAKFSTRRPQAKLTEFCGRYGQYLNSIGVVFQISDLGDGGKEVVQKETVPTLPTGPEETIPTQPNEPDETIPTLPTVPVLPKETISPLPTVPEKTIPTQPNETIPTLPTVPVLPKETIPPLPTVPVLPTVPEETIPTLPTTKDGPFGGPGGVNPWEFKFVGEIREIHIWSANCVHSIMFVYKDNDNKDRSSQKYGGDGGNYQKVIKLAHNESVVGIRGTYGEIYGQTVITSISFLTPYSIYGPFGKNQGTKFSTCRPRTKVTEFFGRHGLFLDSIGVGFPLNDTAGDGGKQVVPIPRLPTMKDEPFGGPGGVYPWEFKFVDEICEIHIWSSNCVYSIMFVYKDHDNKDRSSKRYGGNGGNLEKVILPPNERVIAINGTSGLFHGNMVIMSLSFTTPRRTHGPYGAKGGIQFSITRPEVKFAEFYGRYGQYLHSIGAAYYINDTQRNGVGGELGENIPRLPTAIDGPFGGTNGFIPWEFKFVEEIREIHIKSGSCIDSLRFVYRDNDHKDSNSLQFGSQKKMENVQKVTLAQNEHIIGISGTFGPYFGNTVITSISFVTSKKTYGPYGKTLGTSFATNRRRAKLTEFYGRHGPYLDSIGAVFLMNGTGQDAKEEPSNDDINSDGQLLDTKFVDKNLATGQDAKEEGPSKGEINRDGQLWDLKFVGEIREIYVRSANLRKVTE